ncbi:MAG: MATE family efflux transporter [Planctomycetaceae bacterium]
MREEFGRLARLALPVVAAQLGMMMLGIVDIAMVGRLGARAVAAVALGEVVVFGTWIVGLGLVMGIDPIVSQAHGAKRGAEAGLALQRGIVIGLLASLPIAAAWIFSRPLLAALGQDADLAREAQVYTRSQAFSAAPLLVFMALRQYLQGREIVMAPLKVLLLANLVNVFLNWVLLFGNLGMPALGVRGAALATGLTRLFMAAALALLIVRRRMHAGAWVPWSRACLRLRGLAPVLRYGVPIAIQFALEVWAFNASTLLAGLLGVVPVAAHLVVLKLASLSFMVPLGVSIAAATRVGNLLGAGDRAQAQRAAWMALAMGAGAMLCAATLLLLFRHALPALFTTDGSVIALGATILPIAAAFQLFDGTQAVGGGILRGMGDTRPAALYNLLGYYGVALPLAWWLVRSRGVGLSGIWWSLCAGLFVVAALLVLRVARRGPATLEELAIGAVDPRTIA